MLKFIITAILFFLVTITKGQNVHAFLFCKTGDKKIGNSVRVNYINMRDEMQLIAAALNYKFVEHSITGIRFTSENVIKAMRDADIRENDIVFVYFSTHGAKSKYDSNIFPQLDIPKELVSAYKQHKALLGKKPKFLITAIEACSGYLDIVPQEAFVFEQTADNEPPEKLTPKQTDNIKKLFSSSCEIIITAGNPGKNTWATPQGSMFTNCFLRAMTESFNMNSSNDVTWDKLLNQAKQYTWDMTQTTSIKYYPVWEKTDCNALIQQSEIDTSQIKVRDVKFNVEVTKTNRVKNPYDVVLTISNNSDMKIDKVTYFLHNTFKNPRPTVYNAEGNFRYLLGVWGTFPIKAKVYFSDGKVIDLYKNFDFGQRERKLE